MKTITLVAKGPSSEKASEWIGNTDIAVVNDAGVLIQGLRINYAFFTDKTFCEVMEAFVDRTDTFICTERERGPNIPESIKRKLIKYKDDACGAAESHMIDKITSGGICHHHTTCGAIHWLCKYAKYEKIRIIGVDGGKEYAKGATVYESVQKKVKAQIGDNFLSNWKQITVRLCGVMKKVYGVEFEWYGD